MIKGNDKPKSEAKLRYEKVMNSKMRKHFKALEKEVELLKKQYGINK